MYKVSVIVPVYNSEKYLEMCLDSVICQTLTDMEIICVNDWSTDASMQILKRYAERDKRIKIIQNKKNMGLSFSRNVAIEFASGEYVQFLDSDDYLYDAGVLSSLYDVSLGNNLDVLKNGCFLLEGDTFRKQYEFPTNVVGNVCTGRELLYHLESHNICAWGSCTNFVRLGFLKENRINFYNGILHEDVLYSYELYFSALRTMCINLYTYVYVKRENSITTQRKNIKHVEGYLVGMNEILKKDFADSSLEFKYATIRYFTRMYQNVRDIEKAIGHDVKQEIVNPELRSCYNMLIERAKCNYVDREKIVQNLNMIKKSNGLYIYGAGKAAKELLGILDEYDIPVDRIFVTDIEKSVKSLMGHPVFEIGDFDAKCSDGLFLIAITQKKAGNIEELLHSRGYNNILYVC